MRLTRQGDYAVRVMLDLATHGTDTPVTRAQIQARQRVPAAYLAKTIQALARAGLVRTRPGANGGVSLGRAPDRVTLLRVIEAVEGPIELNRCVVEPDACARDRSCPVHPVWLRLQALLRRELDALTIAALAAAPARAPANEEPRTRPPARETSC
jgi:Rrf2 family protein